MFHQISSVIGNDTKVPRVLEKHVELERERERDDDCLGRYGFNAPIDGI